MPLHVLALTADLRLADCHSLKEKRSVVRTIVDGARRRHQVAAAEIDHLEQWQRALLGFAVISGSTGHAVEVVDQVERFVWSFPEVEVLSCDRHWLEAD